MRLQLIFNGSELPLRYPAQLVWPFSGVVTCVLKIEANNKPRAVADTTSHYRVDNTDIPNTAFSRGLKAQTSSNKMSKVPEINVSNGTCYMADGRESGGAMIPCGNDYFGHVACCQAGDKCLESNACFNDAFDVTYIAGCTDASFEDLNCPWKYEKTGE